MKQQKKKCLLAWAIVLAVVVIDQLIKIYVKTHFVLRESYEVTPWFYLSFIENNGMAYGLEFVDKYALTAFRIVAVAFFSYMLRRVMSRVPVGFVVCVALVIAGALGNIIDCVFYGQLFTDSYGHVAQCTLGTGLEGYAPWFRGRVVDMFYFPLVRFWWPDWMPATGEPVTWLGWTFRWPDWLPTSDEPFLFFKPVFNFADAAISVGVAALILFYRKTFTRLETLGARKDG